MPPSDSPTLISILRQLQDSVAESGGGEPPIDIVGEEAIDELTRLGIEIGEVFDETAIGGVRLKELEVEGARGFIVWIPFIGCIWWSKDPYIFDGSNAAP